MVYDLNACLWSWLPNECQWLKNSCGFNINLFSMSQKFLSESFVNISIRMSQKHSNKCLKLNSISITAFKIFCFLSLIIAIAILIIFTLSIKKPSFASESSFSVYPMDYQPLPIFFASISQTSFFNLHSFNLNLFLHNMGWFHNFFIFSLHSDCSIQPILCIATWMITLWLPFSKIKAKFLCMICLDIALPHIIFRTFSYPVPILSSWHPDLPVDFEICMPSHTFLVRTTFEFYSSFYIKFFCLIT